MKNEQHVIITLFGATGDLAHRKLFPALFRLFKEHIIDEHFAVIGTARRSWSDEYFREKIKEACLEESEDSEDINRFTSHFYYLSHDVTNTAHYVALNNLANSLEEKYSTHGNRLYYMAMAPQFFGLIATHLNEENLLNVSGYKRLLIEKPLGRDLESAIQLDKEIKNAFKEEQIFRIDHYLGKDMIKFLPKLKSLPLLKENWSYKGISKIEVTMAESLGIEHRAGYYEGTGALRDMIQNHALQIIASILSPNNRPESGSQQTLRSISLSELFIPNTDQIKQNFIRGQYGEGDGQLPYLSEEGVGNESRTETYVAGKFESQSPTWKGVPIYFRTGKRMKTKSARVDILFKKPLIILKGLKPINVLSIIIDPNPHITGRLLDKENSRWSVDWRTLTNGEKQIEAYQRLIEEALNGEKADFVTIENLKQTWRLIDPIESYWESEEPINLPTYNSGSMGPELANKIIKDDSGWLFKK
ncbi:glucose-6-phosphate dehydrogenase [Enterococcus thailandicus]|uniref:glucose-6-phosphate dehydrogenase n=1 Tax=Enterococcus thailandicus TaxID=417368 RepID=UPI0022EBE0C2|nr:glucose-6-phosphate dehydrogenase [Enterococcus thailandicus]MDA3972767.1 glucose-6-phosphate dehydrogenase [Enterococcus thailandicus]MDA3975263.1 glucose-6-phosphate dehydrogenase [Enterococcus thailandicus]MDA3980227.1 glucose-6-phosphate dehydrogenase [Enterococcus thailandicus]